MDRRGRALAGIADTMDVCGLEDEMIASEVEIVFSRIQPSWSRQK